MVGLKIVGPSGLDVLERPVLDYCILRELIVAWVRFESSRPRQKLGNLPVCGRRMTHLPEFEVAN